MLSTCPFLNLSITSFACTSMTIKAFRVIDWFFDNFLRTNSTVLSNWLFKSYSYCFRVLAVMLSSTSVVHKTWLPFNTHWPGCYITQSYLLVQTYCLMECRRTVLTELFICYSSSVIQSSTFLPLGSMLLSIMIFSFYADSIATICFFSSNSTSFMFSNTFFRYGWTARGYLACDNISSN